LEFSTQCYMVRVTITPDFLGHSCLESYFVAESDRDAIKDSFSHALALVEAYSLTVLKLEVFDCHIGALLHGISQGGIDRMLFDSDNLQDCLIQEKPAFIG
jgi:hypothetical protein